MSDIYTAYIPKRSDYEWKRSKDLEKNILELIAWTKDYWGQGRVFEIAAAIFCRSRAVGYPDRAHTIQLPTARL